MVLRSTTASEARPGYHRWVALRRSTRARCGSLGALGVLIISGCAFADSGSTTGEPANAAGPANAAPTVTQTLPPSTSAATTSAPTTTSTTSTTMAPSTTRLAPTTLPAATTTPLPTTTQSPPAHPDLPAVNATFNSLASRNSAVSMTIYRDGALLFSRAFGTAINGEPANGDSPMVIASVSKLITAAAIARLQDQGVINVDEPVPWPLIGVTPHESWETVTLRELLSHTSGMPVARTSWFDGSGDCSSFLPRLVEQPPTGTRGRWTYSNGNYCALGLVIEHVTGQPLDEAVQQLVFDPVGVSGLHLTVNGEVPTDVAHGPGVGRLSRLGGAGTYIVSTDDLAAALAATTATDRQILAWPGVITDQYGWGHTGTVSGAKACAWVLEFGRTVIVATVAGNSPETGGGVCDQIVPAIAADLAISDGRPDRTPP